MQNGHKPSASEKKRPELGSQENLASSDSRFSFCQTMLRADQVSTDCVVVTVDSDKKLSPAASAVDDTIGGRLSRLIERGTVS